MATKPSSAASINAWNWVIESMATFKQIDASLVTELAKRTPGGPDDLGRSAKEMFSFRVLETLFVPGTGITKPLSSALDSKIVFDPSDGCADVLERILLETPGSNLKKELEKLKWDIQTFILQKRSCLPKCTLEQLKDAILQGSHPSLASLKERAELLLENQSESGIHVDDGDCSGFADRFEGSTDRQTLATNRNSSSVTTENGGDLFEENFPERNMVPSKKVRITVENGCNTHLDDQDEICIRSTLEQKLAPLHGAEKLDGIAEVSVYTGTESCELSKELLVVDDKQFTDGDGREEYTAFQTIGRSGDVDDAILDGPQEVNFNDDKVPSVERVYTGAEGCELTKEQPAVDVKKFTDDDGREEYKSQTLGRNCDVDVAILDGPQEVNFNDDKVPSVERVYTGTEGCELTKERPAVDVKIFTDDDRREEYKSQTLGRNCDVDDAILDDPQEVRFNGDKVPSGTSKGGETRSFNVEERHDESERSDKVSSKLNCEAKDEMESELSADNVGYLKEMTDIATKKHALLSYKCMLRGENSEQTHLKDSSNCVHCNKGGQLLVCSSDACPLVIHERCLKSADSFDSSGKFYCYFCAYSRSLSEFQDAKQRYSLARKNLAASMCPEMKCWPTNFFEKSYVSEKTAQRLDKLTHKRKRNDVNRVGGTQYKANREVEQVGTSVLYAGADERKGKLVLARNKHEEEQVRHLCHSRRGLEKQQTTGQAVCGTQIHAELPKHWPKSCLPIDDFSSEADCSEGIGTKGCSVVAKEKSITSKYSFRYPKQKPQYTPPEFPQMRRTVLPWTKLEEEMIKEGVRRFSNDQDDSVPWRMILEYGCDVFLKGRTPVDLKDKWRNMKKSQKTK